jgi:hypothetical protein
MPVARPEEGMDGMYRTFEASGGDPASAMERVLADVRAWRSGRFY